jgi:hypothetical protein
MASTPLKNLKMFKKLCGDESLFRVLVTTMWDKVSEELDIAEARLRELKDDYWKHLIRKGSRVDCSHGTAEDAWSIVGRLVNETDKRECILLQKELVDLRRKLNETTAGRAIFVSLEELMAKGNNDLTALLTGVQKHSGDLELLKKLQGQHEKKRRELAQLSEDIDRLKIPLGRRLKIFFSRKARRSI